MKRRLSTPAAAKRIGVHQLTLHRRIRLGAIKPAFFRVPDGRQMWLWSEKDIAKGKKLKKTNKPGPMPKKQGK